MFHIITSNTALNILDLVLEGTLDKEHVVALQDVLDEAHRHGVWHFVLHCERLQAVDDEGIRLLLTLQRDGAKLMNLPLLLNWKLSHLQQQLLTKS